MTDNWRPNDGEDEIPDWLRGDADEASLPESEEAALDWLADLGSAEPAAAPAEEIPDWLSAAAPPEAETPEAEAALPDWLAPTSTAQDTAPAEEVPDWLSALGTVAEEPSAPAEEATLAEEAVPDWMGELGAAAKEEGVPAEAVPDWMSDLGAVAGEEEAAAPAEALPDWFAEVGAGAPAEEATLAEAVPDWMSDLGAVAEEETAPAEALPDWFAEVGTGAPAEEATQAEEAVPDWMSDLGAVAGEEEAAAPAEALPDWFAEVGAGAPVEEATQAEEAVPDWMSDLGAVAGEEEAAAPAEALPDWFAEVGAGAPVEEATLAEEAVPDWMSDLGAMAGEEEAAAPAEALPDWFAEVGAGAPAEEATQAEEAVPDWMSDLGAVAGEEEAAAPAEELPDWIAEVGAGAPVEEATLAEEAVPDWMSDLGAVAEEEEAAAPAEALPDWFAEVGAGAPAEEATLAEEAVPDWMSDLGVVAEERISEEAPDWMGDLGAPIGEAPLPEPALEDEMPEWLMGMQPESLALFDEVAREEEAVEEEAVEAAGEEAIAPADLPSWIEAARPSDRLERWGVKVREGGEVPAWAEALSPFVRDLSFRADTTREESVGPLTGFKGILPAEPLISVPGAPELMGQPVVTERDQKQAQLLQTIAGELYEEEYEGLSPEEEAAWAGRVEARARRRSRRRVRFSPLRVAISLVLLAALIAPFFIQGVQGQPVAASQPVMDTIAQVETVGQGDLVLVAFEYGAAEAVEMSPGAQVVLKHLADRGARIVTLTTNPIGAIIGHGLAAESIEGAAAEHVDLGYLAGFLGGLRALVAHDANPQNPPPARFGFDYRGEATNLNVPGIRERFKLIVVLPGQYETLRAWLEQINSVTAREDATLPGNPVPMVAVVGAGIEPAAAAYRESGQLKGYVPGYAGALAYAQVRGGTDRFDKPEARQVSITVGVVAAALIIVLGNLGYGLRGLLRRRRG